MATIGPASEVDAVNEMLAAIGEDPVADLNSLPPSGNTALEVLRGTARDFLEPGHWFNTDYAVPLALGSGNKIAVPTNVLALTASSTEIIQRGTFLYNVSTRSFTFTASVLCDLVIHLSWDLTPSVARRYITALATERFIDGIPGAAAVTEARNRNLVRAKVAFEREMMRAEGLNLLNNSTINSLTRRS